MMERGYIITKWGWLHMPKITARVTFDTAAAATRIRAASNDAVSYTHLYLDDPYTPEEKRICDEFVRKIKEAKNQEIVFEE